MSDTVAVMRSGRVVQAGPPTDVYLRPAEPWVASFLGDADFLPGVASGGRVETAVGNFASEHEGRVQVMVRPEMVDLVPDDEARRSSSTASSSVTTRWSPWLCPAGGRSGPGWDRRRGCGPSAGPGDHRGGDHLPGPVALNGPAGAGCDPRRGTVSPHGVGQGPARGWWAAFDPAGCCGAFGGRQRRRGDWPRRHVVRASRLSRRGKAHRGPLAGIVTALSAAGIRMGRRRRCRPAVAAPSTTLTKWLGWPTRTGLWSRSTDGIAQVTCAFYPVSWAEAAAGATRRGASRPSFARRSPLAPRGASPSGRAWGEDGRSWFSVDTPAAPHRGAVTVWRAVPGRPYTPILILVSPPNAMGEAI